MLYHLIAKEFDRHIKKLFKDKREIRKYFLTHPRKHKCIEAFTSEVKLMEIKGTKLDYERIKSLTRDICNMFCKAALESHRQQHLSLMAQITESRKFAEMAEKEKVEADTSDKPITIDISDID